MQPKLVSDSRTEQVHIVMSGSLNGAGRLFGGRLMEWIDTVAAVAARRHCQCDVVTVSVERLDFLASAKNDDTVLLVARLVHVGRTSMQVRVDTFVERRDGSRHLINSAYVFLVALNQHGNPTPVPPLELVNDDERNEWNLAEIRRQNRR